MTTKTTDKAKGKGKDQTVRENTSPEETRDDAELAAELTGDLPGVVTPPTKAQLRALELAEAMAKLAIERERVKTAKEALSGQMQADKQWTVKVRDRAGFMHEFGLEETLEVKHRFC